MGIETRETHPDETTRRRWAVSARLWLAVATIVAVGAALSTPIARTGATSDTGARQDRWQAWLADERACPGGGSTTAARRAQLRAMLCLVNFARAREGLRPLIPSRVLNASAAAKASDIARCHDFSHNACGNRAGQAARALGYRGLWGENLYMGNGHLASPRAAVRGWLNSAGHRANLFRPQLRTSGIAMRAHATASHNGRGVTDGVIWVHQLGA